MRQIRHEGEKTPIDARTSREKRKKISGNPEGGTRLLAQGDRRILAIPQNGRKRERAPATAPKSKGKKKKKKRNRGA